MEPSGFSCEACPIGSSDNFSLTVYGGEKVWRFPASINDDDVVRASGEQSPMIPEQSESLHQNAESALRDLMDILNQTSKDPHVNHLSLTVTNKCSLARVAAT